MNTAAGDQAWFSAYFQEAGRVAGAAVSDLRLLTMPNVDDMAAFVLDQDVIWVSGGSVANLLALWRLHGLDEIFRQPSGTLVELPPRPQRFLRCFPPSLGLPSRQEDRTE